MKKVLCLSLLVTLVISNVSFAFAETVSELNQPSPWAVEVTEEAASLGIVPERLQGNWQQDLTRGEFAELVIRFLAVQYGYGAGTGFQIKDFWSDYLDFQTDPNGCPFNKADFYPESSPDTYFGWSWDYILADRIHAFNDVESNGIKTSYINFAYLIGIVEGRGNGSYDPDGIITRQEAAVLLDRTYRVYAALEVPQHSAKPFSDSAEVAPWAREQVSSMQSWGILQGDENEALHPNEHYTREQGVATMMRLYQNMPISRCNGTLAPLLSYADLVGRLRSQSNSVISSVGYENKTEICTILYVTYGNVLRAPMPDIILIYPDSTYKRIGLVDYVEEGFQLIENNTKLAFSDGTPRILDLRSGIFEGLQPYY